LFKTFEAILVLCGKDEKRHGGKLERNDKRKERRGKKNEMRE
jgi:hypothetical protein